jgi:hypothetical protein
MLDVLDLQAADSPPSGRRTFDFSTGSVMSTWPVRGQLASHAAVGQPGLLAGLELNVGRGSHGISLAERSTAY